MPPPVESSTALLSYFEPMDMDVPGPSFDVGGSTMEEELHDYTTEGYSVIDPRESDL